MSCSTFKRKNKVFNLLSYLALKLITIQFAKYFSSKEFFVLENKIK